MINFRNVNRKNSELAKFTKRGLHFWRGRRKCVHNRKTFAQKNICPSGTMLQCFFAAPEPLSGRPERGPRRRTARPGQEKPETRPRPFPPGAAKGLNFQERGDLGLQISRNFCYDTTKKQNDQGEFACPSTHCRKKSAPSKIPPWWGWTPRRRWCRGTCLRRPGRSWARRRKLRQRPTAGSAGS